MQTLTRRPFDYMPMVTASKKPEPVGGAGGGLRPAGPIQARRPHATQIAQTAQSATGTKAGLSAESMYRMRVAGVGAAIAALLWLMHQGSPPTPPPPIPPPVF